jgi:predicted GIY-YIG superfamily endonuclease
VTYVYILRSVNNPDQLYIGWTTDLRSRLKAHNSGNSVPHLSFALTFPLRKRSYGWQANLLKSRRCRRYFSP